MLNCAVSVPWRFLFVRSHALVHLYVQHHGWLRRRLGNPADVADLAHDTYVRVMESHCGGPVGRTAPPF